MKLKFRAHAPSRFHMIFFFLCVLTVGAATLRTLSVLLFFDADIGYFAKGVDTIYIIEGIALALCAACPFLLKGEKLKETGDTLSAPGVIGAVLCTLTFAAAALFLLFRRDLVPAPSALILLTTVFCLLAAIYFALRLTAVTPETLAWFGYGAILAAAMILAITYFDRYTPMNAPHKVSLHVCMLATMLALLLEQRALLDRALPRVRVGITYFAFFLCTVVGISNTVGFLCDAFDSYPYLLFDLVILALAVYFGAKSVELTFPALTESEVEE